MEVQPVFLNDILIRQFKPSFKMISSIIQSCPKSIWAQKNIDPPIWQQIYHALYGIDYWFSESKDSFIKPEFDAEVNSVLGEESKGFIEQKDMMGYLNYVEQKVDEFMGKMDETKLGAANNLYRKWTNLDVIMEQIRHLQHHLGYLNRVLLKCKIKPIEWAYFEE